MIVRAVESAPTIVAVVQAEDGARLVVAARRPEQITTALVDYVLRRADHVLWPRAAVRVRSLIEARDLDGAIATYFACVGSRWDEERLEIHVVGRDDEPAATVSDETSAWGRLSA